MITESELSKFNKKFDAFFEIFHGKRHVPRLGVTIRALAAAIVSHVKSSHLIKQAEIGKMELLLRKVYFASPKNARREFKRAVQRNLTNEKLSVQKVLEHLSIHLSHLERMAILQCLYHHIHREGPASPYDQFLLESLRSAFAEG